jgi:hypothetical protein
MAWIKNGRYYQTSMRLCGQVHTIYLGRWNPFSHEHEAIIQERREWRAARRAERLAAAADLAEVRKRTELVESVTTACLAAVGYHRPKRYGRNYRIPSPL